MEDLLSRDWRSDLGTAAFSRIASSSWRFICEPEIVLWTPPILRIGLGGTLGRFSSSGSPLPIMGTPFTTRGKSLGEVNNWGPCLASTYFLPTTTPVPYTIQSTEVNIFIKNALIWFSACLSEQSIQAPLWIVLPVVTILKRLMLKE